MAIKDFFINSDETEINKDKKEPVKESSKTKFPTQEPQQESSWSFGFKSSTPQEPTAKETTQVSQEYVDKALDAYKQGLLSLKKDGYDFQNFYEALSEEDKNNPASYQMAVRFASSMDKSITKDKLVSSADYYLSQIEASYNNYVNSGNDKKQKVLSQKDEENHNLKTDLDLLEQQAQAIQVQIQDRRNKIASIDGKYSTQLNEIDAKLLANSVAKNKVVGSFEKVKQGIINNVK